MSKNQDARTVRGFGDEWSRFDQRALSDEERGEIFKSYFGIFPWAALPARAVGFDLGSGSGRWAACVAPRVGTLHCVDASEQALGVARRNLAREGVANCEFHHASVDAIPLADASMDFGYSLGVLHHVPDTQAGLAACVRKLKVGAPFLLYLYYAMDNRPAWYRALWRTSELLRYTTSSSPLPLRYALSQAIAAGIYFPLARAAQLAERLGLNARNMPLYIYRDRSFYTMRTDALDRFGTKLEQRFSRVEIEKMMTAAGLERITFSEALPYWCAVGYRAR
ncbi:MAG: class I SAM-dependent methyltransferase [Deltaproteobacteria bacterium]|nr:class I SAM-dependent methyltransferase [Deltaproteobacteria bacterium]